MPADFSDLPAAQSQLKSKLPSTSASVKDSQGQSLSDMPFQGRSGGADNTPATAPVDPKKLQNQKAKSTVKPPSLQNYFGATKTNGSGNPRKLFAEETNPTAGFRLNSVSPKFKNMHKQTPQERATNGAYLGGAAGYGVGGEAGALVGGMLGPVFNRAAGMVQSGEFEDNKNKQLMVKTMSQLGGGEPGAFSFEDGAINLPLDPNHRIKNLNPNIGKGERTIYDIDKSNPLSIRTSAVATPIAQYIARGIHGMGDSKNERHAKNLSNTVGMLTNVLQAQAGDIDTVYSRARQMVNKFGVSESQMRDFFSGVRNELSPEEAEQVTFGLEKIFGNG